MENHSAGAIAGTYSWHRTKIRRKGMAGYRNLRSRSFFKRAAVYLAIFFVFALGYVWMRVQVIETGYRLRQLEVTRDKLKSENKSLSVEAATLRSPQRVEALAASMDLKRPTESQVRFISGSFDGSERVSAGTE